MKLFSAQLMLSNSQWYKYKWHWKKGNKPTGFLNAKKQPLRIMKESGKNLETLLEQTYKNQTIVEQQIVYNDRKRNVDKRLYIITTDRNHEEYTLWLDGNKLGKASNPTELYDKIK